MSKVSAMMRKAAGAAPAAFWGVGLLAATAPVADAACTTPVCLAPGPQSTKFAVPVRAPDGSLTTVVARVTSTGVYQPISIWNMGGGNFDIAFTMPLVPVAVTYGPQTNNPPVNYQAVLNRPWGGYVGAGAAGQWTYAVAVNPLPAQSLDVTAYQVYAGPNFVGIAGAAQANGFSSGFAVQAPANLPGIPAGTAHWVQVIADNFNISNNPGFGNPENILDNGGVNFGNVAPMPPVTSPYYDALGAADGTSFYDAPRRNNQANLAQSNWWIGDVFLATGSGPTGPGSRGQAPGTVILSNPGIQYGWGNFHLSIGGLGFGALRNLFAQDTSSVSNFEVALDCNPSTCPLSSELTQTYLNQLDMDFNVAGVPEPATWTQIILGVGLAGAWMRRRRAAAAA